MARPRKSIDISTTHRKCFSCGEIKELKTKFSKHKTGIKGYRADCNKCKSWAAYQKTLGDMIDNGSNNVVECSECECYMMKQPGIIKCVNCRRKNGEVDNEKYIARIARKRRRDSVGIQEVSVLEAKPIGQGYSNL